jgi:predicted secreted hydrolase
MILEISTPLKDQELALPGLVYWEGLTHATGSAAGAPITGHGYLELTGYGAALTGIGE